MSYSGDTQLLQLLMGDVQQLLSPHLLPLETLHILLETVIQTWGERRQTQISRCWCFYLQSLCISGLLVCINQKGQNVFTEIGQRRVQLAFYSSRNKNCWSLIDRHTNMISFVQYCILNPGPLRCNTELRHECRHLHRNTPWKCVLFHLKPKISLMFHWQLTNCHLETTFIETAFQFLMMIVHHARIRFPLMSLHGNIYNAFLLFSVREWVERPNFMHIVID